MYRSLILLFLIFTINGKLFSENGTPEEELGESVTTVPETAVVTGEAELHSPFHTVLTHLRFLQMDNWVPELAAEVFRTEDVGDEGERYAVMLKQILDGKGLFVDIDIIPQDANYIDSASRRHRYYIFKNIPEIYVEKHGDNWYYSRRTVEVIPRLHRETFPFGSDFLMNLFPEFGQQRFLGLHVWQHIGVFFIILIALILHKLMTVTFSFFINRMVVYYEKELDHVKAIKKISVPISYLLLTMIVSAMVPTLLLPIESGRFIVMGLRALTPLFAAIAMYKAVDLFGLYLEKQAAKTSNSLDDMLVPLLRKTLKIFVVVIGVLFVLQNLNVNVTALLAGLSIGGLAFAFAAQDTLKNFFGSLMIFTDKPFQIGDWINFQGVDGMVEEVGFRSTRVRTFANSLVTVPNGSIVNMVVDNFGMRNYRRFMTHITITYDTPPELIQAFVEGLRKIVEDHPDTRKDFFEVQLNELGSHSINILFMIFFKVPTWSLELKARHEILMSIINLAKRLGVRFAFPTQTMHIEEFPEKKALSPVYDVDEKNIQQKLAAFFKQRSANQNNPKP